MTDLQLTESQQATISALMRDEGAIPPPLHLARGAYLRNDAVERDRARRDPDGFWAEQAAGVDWMEPWTSVSDIRLPDHAWFLGGRLNASANCLDRHVHGERRNTAALIWIGEDGEEHTYTYARLYREVNRFANALRRLGVGKGDRVVVYMPLVPEGIMTMLACARIGAVHSVVYAGMGTQALSSRIADSGARVVVCTDFTFRRGKKIPLKPTVDEAVRDAAQVEWVVVHRRGSRPGDEPYQFESEREVDFYEGSLVRHPSVGEAAVIGLPDPVKGERIKAFVVLRKGVEAGPGLVASLKDHVRQDLGPIAQPSEIEVRDLLPKTRSGKIVRRYLKAVEMGEDPGDLSTLAD